MLQTPQKMIGWSRRIVTSSSASRVTVGGLTSRSLTRSFTVSGLIRSVSDGGDKAPVYSLSDFPVAIDEVTTNTVATSEAVVNAAVHELTWRPPDMVMWLIDNIHVVYEIPYWESIVVTTLGLRFLMLPLAIKTVQNASRMAVLRPHMQRTQDAFLKDPRYEEMDVKIKYQNDIKALFKEHKVNPFRSLLMPIAQIPVFLSFFLGLREMGNQFPGMATVRIPSTIYHTHPFVNVVCSSPSLTAVSTLSYVLSYTLISYTPSYTFYSTRSHHLGRSILVCGSIRRRPLLHFPCSQRGVLSLHDRDECGRWGCQPITTTTVPVMGYERFSPRHRPSHHDNTAVCFCVLDD